MVKKVSLYTDPKDSYCMEIEKFLRELEIILDVHDTRSNPLTVRQLSGLLGHVDPSHFLSPNGSSGKARKPDLSKANRDEILEAIAKDNSIMQLPIVVCGRLKTVGYDRRNILSMLQIKMSDSQSKPQTGSAA